MMEEAPQFSRLRDFLKAVVDGSPRFGVVKLWSQWLELTIDFGAGEQAHDYQSIYIQAYSLIRFEDTARSVAFTPPINDLDGSVPSAVFGLEGERIEGIDLNPGQLTIITSRATVRLSFHDGPWEAVRIGRVGEADAFIL